MAEFHRVAALAAGHAAERTGVSGDFGQRHFSGDRHQAAAGGVSAQHAAAPPRQVAVHIAEMIAGDGDGDGHNRLQQAGPRLLHVVTEKGRGFKPAEENPCLYPGLGSFYPETGNKLDASSSKPTYTQIFSDWVCDMAAADDKLVAITPAMREGSGLVDFSEKFPARYHDVGIAEQHAVTLAAGMACEGIHPVVAIYSTFLQRA